MGMVAILHVTINIRYKFTPLNLRSLNMKFEISWPIGFWENGFNILMELQYKRHWLNGQSWSWPLELYWGKKFSNYL